MGIAHYIKDIGRGKEGARSLNAAQAEDLLSQVLDRQVGELEIGAFCVAMRIKGETTEELAGFLKATLARCLVLQPPSPAVILPSYNGARKLPNFTPLLAQLLARQGLPVLVHGPRRDPTRVNSAEIFEALGWEVADSADAVHAAWAQGHPAYVPTEVLCPPLAGLLAVRQTIGLRNPGHTVAKLLDPTPGQAGLRVVNYTHPEYGGAHAAFLVHTEANALLMRGTEGEPAADPRRHPRFEVYLHGQHRPDLSQAAQEGPLTQLPDLPRAFDAVSTAHAIRSCLAGQAPIPEPLAQQVQRLVAAVKALQA